MKKHFADFKTTTERAKQKRVVDCRAAEPSFDHFKKSEASALDDEEAQIEVAIQANLDDQ